ncbi:MAG: protein-tyrosine kinase [Dysgonamonadaceae bacterium]|jgi:hypothetical protein|nr:protein-tyrosine kinase [Dysgonamonadaceae bacterium]
MNREIITIENGIVHLPQSNNIWMTQYELAKLFECFVAKVNSNVRSILKIGVLDERAVCRTYYYKNGGSVEKYNLEMIIALSFRINSHKAKIFREWLMRKAITNTVSQQILKGIEWNNAELLN